MRLSQSIIGLVVSCAMPTCAASSNSRGRNADTNKIPILGWPMTGVKPEPMALIELTPSTDGQVPVASLFHYRPPSLYSTTDDIIRIGLLDPETKNWTGTAVTRQAFDRAYDRKFILRYDPGSGQVYHVSLQTTLVPAVVVDKKIKDKKLRAELTKQAKEPPRAGLTSVEIAPISPPPEPVLNRPVVLDYDGKAPEPATEPRSFLQKYWWAILLFVLVNLAFSAGPEEEKN